MQMKVVFVLLFLVLGANGVEFEWGENSLGLTKNEQESAINDYVGIQYPKKAKLVRKKLEIEKQLYEKQERKQRKIRENTVTVNGLMWQDNYASKTIQRDWKGAKKYCRELKLLGFTNWFLPSIEQLKSIVDKKRSPAIKKEFKNIISSGYWSSSSDLSYSYDAWYVYFEDGYSGSYVKTGSIYVRCARVEK